MTAQSPTLADVAFADIERAAKLLAETRVPGSTRSGGHYFLSEAWRMLIQRQARAELERAASPPLAA